MKTIIVVAGIIVILAAGIILWPNPFWSQQRSKILVAKTEIKTQENGDVLIKIPIATLPKEKKAAYDTLVGTVGKLASSGADFTAVTALLMKDGDPVIITNIPYVHTLEYLYFDREVQLKGNWKKDVVVYGKKYRSFWVEDFQLAKK